MVARFDAFTLDSERRQLFRAHTAVHLTPKAFDLLVLLATHAPRVVSKRELHEQLWPGTFVSDATLTGVIKELRRALDDRSPDTPIIRTAHRVGYALNHPVERLPVQSAPVQHWLVLRGRRVALRDGDHLIGRDASCEISLDDVNVSRRHAQITISGTTATLKDLHSKNGTTVAGQPVRGEVVLSGEERIEFGAVAAVYRTAASDMSTETRSRIRAARPAPSSS